MDAYSFTSTVKRSGYLIINLTNILRRVTPSSEVIWIDPVSYMLKQKYELEKTLF